MVKRSLGAIEKALLRDVFGMELYISRAFAKYSFQEASGLDYFTKQLCLTWRGRFKEGFRSRVGVGCWSCMLPLDQFTLLSGGI